MTESPVPPAQHARHDLSIDQQLALRTAAAGLQREFGDNFGVETIERFLYSSHDQFARRATVIVASENGAEIFTLKELLPNSFEFKK